LYYTYGYGTVWTFIIGAYNGRPRISIERNLGPNEFNLQHYIGRNSGRADGKIDGGDLCNVALLEGWYNDRKHPHSYCAGVSNCYRSILGYSQ